MRWRRSEGHGDQIEDRRAQSGGSGGLGGMKLPGGKGGLGGLGILGVVIALVVAFMARGGGDGLGLDLPQLDALPTTPAAQDGGIAADLGDEENLREFVTFVVGDVQTSWSTAFRRAGLDYETTRLVLFRNGVSTACGSASSAMGPFYCPADHRVYLDLDFFRELRTRFGAPGDFAQAYVIAHEFGHHVQNIRGIMTEVTRRQREDPGRANDLSVRLELQADCLAGVWAHSAYEADLLEDGDLEEGLAAAAAVGDDRIQSQAGMRVDPDAFTHGTSQQRERWFTRGFEGGSAEACDTFSGGI